MRRQNGVLLFSIAVSFEQKGVWENAIWSKGCKIVLQSEHQLQDIQLLNSEKEIVLRRKGRSLSSHKRDASALSRL
ncbi:MAG: hypothetical protein MR891_06780 [Bacteroidales bacterium]|nr:hypothetical protein [Bacteroidales bacterium]